MDIVLIIYVALFIYFSVRLWQSNRKIIRNNEVLDFRLKWFLKDKAVYNNLPSFKEMVESKKPLEDRYWIK